MTVNRSNLVIGQAKIGNKNYGDEKKIHPYMRNNFKGTPEIQETFARISKRHTL